MNLDGAGNPDSVFALNVWAREFSDWGAAAIPGSPADEMMKMLAEYPEAKQAEACVEAAT